MSAQPKQERPTWRGPFHQREIPRGTYGEISKIEEERQEALDALEQEQLLMLMVELADLVGAIEGVTSKQDLSAAQLYHQVAEPPLPEWNTAQAREVLATVGDYLEQAAQLPPTEQLPSLGAALGLIVALAARFSFTFHDLNHFAKLRSAVARHALSNP